MVICSYTFRWSDYKTPADAEMTARWFATWVRVSGAQLSCHVSDDGPVVTTQPRDEYREFSRSLRERASGGEKLPTVVPGPLREHAEKGYAPEDVAPQRADEGFMVDPSTIDWDAIDTSAWRQPPKETQHWQPTDPAHLAALLSTEQATNAIRMIANPGLLFTACKLLGQVGMRKPLFRSPERHIYDSVLSNATAMQVILQYALLCGAPRAGGRYPFWDGRGDFLGWQRGAHIADFKSGGKEDSLLIIKLNHAEEIIAPLLQPLPSD